MLHRCLLLPRSTVTAEVYPSQLKQLASVIRLMRRKIDHAAILYHNGGRHVVGFSHQKIAEFAWKVPPLPSYPHNLARRRPLVSSRWLNKNVE